MKRSILFLILINLFSSLAAQLIQPYSVRGGSGTPLRAEDDSRNRLQVYLLNGLSGVQISFTSSNTGTHQWYRYRESGNNAVPVPSVQDGNTSYITDVQDGYGYFVGLPTEPLPYYVWIIDYSQYVPHFFSLKAVEDEDRCSSLRIEAEVEIEPLIYYLPSSAQVNLIRTYNLQYDTQVWDENSKQFLPQEKNMELSTGFISETLLLDTDVPRSDTYFTLTGDQFAEHFGIQQAIRSDLYQAVAVEAHYTVETTKEQADNELHKAGDDLGGSSPIEYTFTAYANEPVAAFYIWKISQQNAATGDMTAIVRYTDKILRYNFEQNGIYNVDLEVIDGRSVCFDTIPTFKVIIDSTVVKIPNAFSPGSSIGVNDELKIAFSSVVTFKASVFNRWGNLLYQWNDPTKGWDGRVNGKFVPTGVYYVVVEYKDSSGKNRSASRAVNVLRTKN